MLSGFDVIALNGLIFKLFIGLQQLEGGRQIVVHQAANVRQLFRVFSHLVKNLSCHLFQTEHFVGNNLSLQTVVGLTNLLNHIPSLTQGGCQLWLSGECFFLFFEGFLLLTAALLLFLAAALFLLLYV